MSTQAITELLNEQGRDALRRAADQASSVTSREPQDSDIVHGLVVAD